MANGGNVLSVGGVGLQSFQPLNVGEAFYERGQNQLVQEERQQRMGLAESRERRAQEAAVRAEREELRKIEEKERADEEWLNKLEQEALEKAQEAHDYFYETLMPKVKDQASLDAALRLYKQRFPEDALDLEDTFPGGVYNKKNADQVKAFFKEKVEPLLVEPRKERVWIEGKGFVTELESEEAEEPKVSQDVADFQAIVGRKPKDASELGEFLKDIGRWKPPTGDKPTYEVFADSEGNQFYVEKGTTIPPGARKVSPSAVTINMPKAAPSGERESLNKLFEFRQKLDRIATEFEGGFVGRLEGPVGALKELTGLGVKEKESAFRQVVKDIADTLLRLRSGAQINEQEYRRLTKLVPTLNLPDKVFLARLKSLTTAIDSAIKTRRGTLEESGFVAPGVGERVLRFDAEGNPIE